MTSAIPSLLSKLRSFLVCFFVLPASVCLLAENPGMTAVKYSADYNWSIAPNDDLTQSGVKTISLSACPAGVKGSEPEYWAYVSGRGTPEAVKVTGGTCAGNGAPGTLQFTTGHSHAAGYSVGSASSGLQEALVAARFSAGNPTAESQSGKVMVSSGEFDVYARVSVRASNITVDFSGSIVDCWMDDTCIYVGDPANSSRYLDVTVTSPRGRPMVAGGQHPFLEINAQKTRVFNVSTRLGGKSGSFSSYVQVDDDQAFLLDGLDTSLGANYGTDGLLCNAETCNPVIYAPGGKTWAVGWLKHLNLSMACVSNGIDWESGNSLRVTDSVIQGYAQYAIRAGNVYGGGQGLTAENVYGEIGNCKNPAGKIGHAGIIAQGGSVVIHGALGLPGASPLFADTGKTEYRYYIVARSAEFGVSNALYAGKARTNGSGAITITTPDIVGATSFDLLRVTYRTTGDSRLQTPNGTANYAVATGVFRSSVCDGEVCRFTDSQAPLTSYKVASPTYFPWLRFWPGSIILGAASDSGNAAVSRASILVADGMPDNVVSVMGPIAPSVIASYCGVATEWTPLISVCLGSTFMDTQQAIMLPVKRVNDGGLSTNLKGKTNYGTLGSGPSHIITLADSNFDKTVATANNRPDNDADDAFIGYDQHLSGPSGVGISFGAPVSLSNYIGNVGDGTNWLERLTAKGKSFRVPISTDSQITSTVSTGIPPFAVNSTTPVPNLTLSNHPRIQNCGSTSQCSAQVLTNGQIVFGTATLAGASATVGGLTPGFTSADSFQCTASDKSSATASANALALSANSIRISGKAGNVISYICVGN